jgi:hypothetical protein
VPETGLHSVMLKPDSVRRVTPPTTITAKTSPADPSNHPPTPGDDSTGSWVTLAFAEKNRGSNRADLRAVDVIVKVVDV